ncbi:MAG: peptidoglycan bridge formation glycyltransferase FemA/FemB family protein [Candidatus Peregrinibacteria bacterium]|nr:peptidoglycan bridge formation glycyltransferase FemA/FemB family protein [Candidatus Peregrinibacteria bacterium]
MTITEATNAREWDAFLTGRAASPFLQSWTMGEVYRALGQDPVRIEIRDGVNLLGICFGHIVSARRGRHLSIPYGPVFAGKPDAALLIPLLAALEERTRNTNCTFIRMSPFWLDSTENDALLSTRGFKHSPLHLLAEHLWYVPLRTVDPWEQVGGDAPDVSTARPEEELLMELRKTTRNLVRRAEREGVTVSASTDPVGDLPHFLALHDETRKRHGFTPYTDRFFREQVAHFSPESQCSLYLARYQGEVIAASIHMHFGGETSYHHGASTAKYAQVPASYLLQWTAICDARRRGDRIYNFWGISPEGAKKHPFAGVRTFKTGFGGKSLSLQPCVDLPLSPRYRATRLIEQWRKWRRGF